MVRKYRTYQLSATLVTVFAHLLAIAITTLVLVWLLKFQGGLSFSSSNKAKLFNWHPLLMVIGFILVGGEAIMAYKTVPARRDVQKTIHLILHLVALVAGILGFVAVFKTHEELGFRNFVSLHSWLGISAISLFGLQWVLGFFSFVFPQSNSSSKASYLPWHVFMGMFIFLLAVCTALMGITEMFNFQGLGRNQEAHIVNFAGLLIFLFAASVGFTLLLPRGY